MQMTMICRSDMELREYQKELVEKVFQAYRDGFKAPCVVLPCGGGKSVIEAEIARRFTDDHLSVLFLVHRRELCQQIWKTFLRSGANMELCRVMMVQTMVRRLKSSTAPSLIITDENHHSLANTYKKIYAAFPEAKRLGVTATPERLDGSGLADVNDILIEGVTAGWLIDNGFLSAYDYYAPGIKMPKFRINHGDYDIGQIGSYFNENVRKIYGDVLKHYRKIADGKQAICYLPTVEASVRTADLFTSSGIPAAHIDGTTPDTQRQNIINSFRDGSIRILCNVDIISEGFDVPDCECAILLRPTKSLTLFIQQAMRCMRYKPGKRAVIIDHVNNIDLHGFPDADREWTLEGQPKKKGEKVQVKTCPECFACVPISVTECPHCGHVFVVERRRSEAEYDEKYQLVKLAQTEQRVRFYLSPKECRTVDELKIYARQHGYKPGWVWYQQKSRGWLDGGREKRNSNSKRYPCRPV